MAGMMEILQKQSKWLVVSIGLILVALVGFVDYLTGDYSLLIFYLMPIALVSWYAGRGWGAFIAVASGTSRFVTDYALYANLRLLYWNSIEDMVFLIIVSFLIAILKKALDSDRSY
jgi:hypothetical protein